jgi:chromosome segregation ATPase
MNIETRSILSLNQVAKLTGRSKGTISKALNDGTLSYLEKSDKGVYQIDMAEALRVFPPKTPQNQIEQDRTGTLNTDELRHSMLLQTEIDRLQYRVETAETERQRERDSYRQQIDDLQSQRDKWQKQAEQTLKIQFERDAEQSEKQAQTTEIQQSEQEKRVQAEQEAARLREQLKNTENAQKEAEQQLEKAEAYIARKNAEMKGQGSLLSRIFG